MSNKIVVLPKDIREKIRAGEVIERPSSVVKELIENAIDAESARIICEIEGGGAKRIKVIDDGTGMSPADIEQSLKRYATSKIRTLGDLTRLKTLGFRGEALPSIKAIAELSIESKRESDTVGFRVVTQGNDILEKKPQQRTTGTTVEVKRLFFNTPARRKFLKSESTEFRHIRKAFIALALRHHAIHFSLFNNGNVVLDLAPVSSLKERFGQILKGQEEGQMYELKHEGGGLCIQGVSSRPEYAHATRDAQYTFVNARWVYSNLVRQAVYKAYGQSLWGKHPDFVIDITIPGRLIDINVHPSKKEVKFKRERDIFEGVYAAIQDAITDKAHLPEIEREGRAVFSGQTPYGHAQEQTLFVSEERMDVSAEAPTVPKGFWQLHGSYIFASTKTGFMIVDQHAAHERVIYDQIIRRKEAIPPQMLLFPLRVDLTIGENEFVEDHIDGFYELGFRIKRFSGNSVVIEGIPPFMREINEDVLHELLQEMMEEGSGKDVFQKMAQELACQAAVKAGEELTSDEMNKLFDSLFATDNPYTCPHGRPTMIKFTIEELGRKFRRR